MTRVARALVTILLLGAAGAILVPLTRPTEQVSPGPASSPSPQASPLEGESGEEQLPTQSLSPIEDQPRVASFNSIVDPETLPGCEGQILDGARPLLVADMPLLLQVPEKVNGDLAVEFLGESDGSTQPLQYCPRLLSANHAILYWAGSRPDAADIGGDVRIAVRDAGPLVLPIRLAIPRSAHPRIANGLIRIVLIVDDQAVPATSTVFRVAGGLPQVKFAPGTFQVRVTRSWGWLACSTCLLNREVEVQVFGQGQNGLTSIGPLRAILTNGRNGDLGSTVEIVREGQDITAMLRVDYVTQTGRYEGSVLIDPSGAETSEIPVAIEVQDPLWLPFIWLLLFSFAGGYLISFWNTRRRQSLLRGGLKEAVERYDSHQPPPTLVFESDRRLGLAAPTYPTKHCETIDDNFVDTTYCLIGKARSDDEFGARTADVNLVIGEVDRWLSVARAAHRLRTTLKEAKLPDADPSHSDGLDLLDAAGEDPGVDATKTLVSNMDQQARIHSRYAQLLRAWERLTPDQQNILSDRDPAKVYMRLADRKSPEDWAALRLRLVQALGDVERLPLNDEALRSLLSHREDFPVDLQDLESVAPRAAASLRAFVGSVTLRAEYATLRSMATPVIFESTSRIKLEDQPAPPPDSLPTDRGRARDIFSRVRRWDLVVAIVTALITTLAFLLPLYSSHIFGSWEDYAKLATVGFLGSATAGGLALNWTLFPAMRSYSLSQKKGS